MKPYVLILSLVAVLLGAVGTANSKVRIKDIVDLQGVRDNQLLGYGLVVGLNASGDSLRNSPFTDASIKAMLDRLGIGKSNNDFRTKNVAAVLVTANLPAFANTGSRIDVNLSSIGDASSLQGGTLVFTPLYGGDGEIYAMAQGGLVVSGFSAEGDAANVSSNTPTSARIPNGAVVETAAPGNLNDEDILILQLANPDFSTAVSIVDRINEYTLDQHGQKLAKEVDHQSVVVKIPRSVTATRFYASIGKLAVEPDIPARIVIDERTGTVIIGSEVTVSKVAITHGGLTVSVTETPVVSQPLPFSEGQTALEPNTEIFVAQEEGALGIVDAPNLQQLVNGLNMMGAKPSSIIAIIQGIKSAGALQAELVVQ